MVDKNLNTRRVIPVGEIKPGMFVVSLDQAWLKSPFFFHRKLITSVEEIEALKHNGVREVIIDTARGIGLDPLSPVDRALPEENRPAAGSAALDKQAASGIPSPADVVFQPLTEELPEAHKIREEALAAAQTIFDGAVGGAVVKTEVAKTVVTELNSTIARSPEASLLLMQMRRFQHDLFTHAVNVCVLSLVVGTIADLPVNLPALGLGALLHDVGETRIPRNLLRNRDGFTEAERRLAEQHPKLGAMLLQPGDDMPESARRIVLDHHERIDGSGYPERKRGEEISLMSQIVAIADAYDDMLSGRNQAMLQPIEVLRQLFLRSNAGALDRELVERIIRCLGVYPVGSLVELSSGERGIVIAANRADTLRPTVRIIMSCTGIPQSKGRIVNLADTSGGSEERRIVGCLDPGKERLDPMTLLKVSSAAAG